MMGHGVPRCQASLGVAARPGNVVPRPFKVMAGARPGHPFMCGANAGRARDLLTACGVTAW